MSTLGQRMADAQFDPINDSDTKASKEEDLAVPRITRTTR